MPDGDIVHDKLPRRYLKPYAELCEGKLTEDECIWSLLHPLKRDIQRAGNPLIQLAKRLASHVDRLPVNDTEVDWKAASLALDREAAQYTGCFHRDTELLLNAAKNYLHSRRYGWDTGNESASEAIIERYIQGMYRANFEECVPLTPKHHAGVSPAILNERLLAIRPKVHDAISYWAKTVNSTEDVTKIRRPRRRKLESISLAERLD